MTVTAPSCHHLIFIPTIPLTFPLPSNLFYHTFCFSIPLLHLFSCQLLITCAASHSTQVLNPSLLTVSLLIAFGYGMFLHCAELLFLPEAIPIKCLCSFFFKGSLKQVNKKPAD